MLLSQLDDFRDALAEALDGMEGAARALASVDAAARPALEPDMTTGPDAGIPVGASKLGGCPDLPPDHPWPEQDGEPLVFLFQLALAEVADIDVAQALLPPDGLLLFFYNAEEEPWDGREGAVVLHVPAAGLERREPPANLFDAWEEVTEGPARITWTRDLALPGLHHPAWPFDEDDDELGDLLHDLAGDVGLDFGNFGMLGQGAPLQPCDPVARVAEQVGEDPADWFLLAECGGWFTIADDGTLFVCMRRADAQARRFDQARFVVVSG